MWSEALSALRETMWRGGMSEQLASVARSRLLGAPVQRRTPDALYEEAWHVAKQLGWAKTYDAEYVALARMLDCPLLTLDEKLRRGAGHLIRILAPADLDRVND